MVEFNPGVLVMLMVNIATLVMNSEGRAVSYRTIKPSEKGYGLRKYGGGVLEKSRCRKCRKKQML